MGVSFRHSAGFGKRMEYNLVSKMLMESLAIRKYTEVIDFEFGFYEQIDNIEDAFRKARELQELVKDLKF